MKIVCLIMEQCVSLFDIATITIAIATFVITSITLGWFMRDREKQNKKEFEQLVYDSIKDITAYLIDIDKIKEAQRFISLDDIKRAEMNFTAGFTRLEIYGKSHHLEYLEQFAVINSKRDGWNKNSFSYHFYDLNNGYQKYREEMFGQEATDPLTIKKLECYYKRFIEYLSLAFDYTISVLYLDKRNDSKKDVQEFFVNIHKIVRKCKKDHLYAPNNKTKNSKKN